MLVMERNEKSSGYDAYCIYISLKSHFNTKSYDFFKYGKKKIKQSTYMSRSDRIFFEKIAKKHKQKELVEILIANLIQDNNFWVKDFFSSEAEENHIDWKKRNESIEYVFRQDCDVLFDFLEENNLKFDSLFLCGKDGNHPWLLKFLMRKEVSPETFCILNMLVSFMPRWNDVLSMDPVWSEIGNRYAKYEKFLSMSKERKKKMSKIVVDNVTNRDIL